MMMIEADERSPLAVRFLMGLLYRPLTIRSMINESRPISGGLTVQKKEPKKGESRMQVLNKKIHLSLFKKLSINF
jgi:hypothetical protein